MKTIHLAVLVLAVCFSCAEALKCYRCTPPVFGGGCIDIPVECYEYHEFCVTVLMENILFPKLKACATQSDVERWQSNPTNNVYVCDYDLCN
ncbi:ly6/PLAUR domain-containing protein 2-like [Cheilinus undulatus]|uniref:ly6/PLAUR domain-containing protein 2-like n=1 Tax=Cheilinus undulatus TaxID=241271 RepID=UPI001BD6A671|nr:ly6/PLAUR domain-containing protein 2-like [Cheilinus undulatus]